MSEKLESFKIADKRKTRVSSAAAVKAEPPPEHATLGFARIEGILDSEEPGAVFDKLHRLHSTLEQQEAAAKTPKSKSSFKKARLAVERTLELLDYLFRTKAAMVAMVSSKK